MGDKPVDTAIAMVVGPCIDDTDFKTLEEAIAYNAAGMDISLIVEKTDGTTAVTAITLTTAGTSDWTHKDGGYYEVEITAAQNIEEGIGFVRGVCTGVLPFESPRYNIVVANIYDSLTKGTDKLQVDATEISGDSAAADNLEADYDGTGYTKTNSTIGTCTTNTDMVGTNGANTVIPDAAGVAPTAIEIRTEMDTNSTKMAPSQVLNDYKATGFNTVVPDAAGTAPTAAEINAEIVDVLTVDTTAEMPQGAPPATPTFQEMWSYTYFRMRNKCETTATEDAVYDNAGTTKLFKATIGDNGTTFSKSEYVSGI